jgi:hypothetical protein
VTKEQIAQAMADAGLMAPRVIPHRGGDGKTVFNLYAGHASQRRVEEVPKNASEALVREAIAKLNGT